MSRRSVLVTSFVFLALVLGAAGARADGPGPSGPAAPLGNAFTYQGQLQNGGQPVNGNCDMGFRLYGQASGGAPVASVVSQTVPVAASQFTVALDFGAGAFDGSARWLDVTVRCPAGSGAFAHLDPRQALTAAPYALYARNNWALGGNAGTNGGNFLGTTDNISLTLAINNTPVMRYAPNLTSPNIFGGYTGNSVAGGLAGSVIAGGGSFGYPNQVGGNYTTISGGQGNSANGDGATIGGGRLNVTGFGYATVGGGYSNTATVQSTTIAGGELNTASNYAATVGGGGVNTAGGVYAVVGGGYGNRASGAGAFIGGGGWNNTAYGGNVASGHASVVGGGFTNTAAGLYDVVGGGSNNHASLQGATIGGGEVNTASEHAATVGGGGQNVANAGWATVSGGYGSTASGQSAVVGGGESNMATTGYATIGGGIQNTASGGGSTVSGGEANKANNGESTVGGGGGNTASGFAATVPGGELNAAQGAYSLAAGRQAHAVQDGTFIWADSTNTAISTTVANEFLVRASGGVTMYSNSAATVGAQLAPGSGSWSSVSDRNLKANFSHVDDLSVLAALAGIPMQTWNYQSQAASIRHLGPMAQDFRAAFGLGENDTTISTVDAQGVALAGVQGLYHLAQDQAAQLKSQQAQIDDLQARLRAVEQTRAPAAGEAATLPWGWLMFGGLLLLNGGGVAGYVLARRKRT